MYFAKFPHNIKLQMGIIHGREHRQKIKEGKEHFKIGMKFPFSPSSICGFTLIVGMDCYASGDEKRALYHFYKAASLGNHDAQFKISISHSLF